MRTACWSMDIALGETRNNFSRHRQAVCLTPGVESLGEGREGRGKRREGREEKEREREWER